MAIQRNRGLAGGLNRRSPSLANTGLRNMSRAQGEGRRRKLVQQGAAWQRDLRKQEDDAAFKEKELAAREEEATTQREFQAGEAEKGRVFQGGLVKSGQEHQSEEAGKSRKFSMGQTKFVQKKQAKEAEKDRTFKGGLAKLGREHQVEEAEKDRALKGGLAKLGREHHAGEAEKERELRGKLSGRQIEAQRQIAGLKSSATRASLSGKASAAQQAARSKEHTRMQGDVDQTRKALASAQARENEAEIQQLTDLLGEQEVRLKTLGPKEMPKTTSHSISQEVARYPKEDQAYLEEQVKKAQAEGREITPKTLTDLLALRALGKELDSKK